jgi:Gly-Xaa carboxypeptidase
MELWHRASLIAGALFISWLCIATIFPSSQPSTTIFSSDKGSPMESWCPLPHAVSPTKSTETSEMLPPSKDISGNVWINRQVERLSAAVNVPTESYDDNGNVEEDPRWRTFPEFHSVLQNLFPLVHDRAEREFINRYGLVFTLKGTATNLKPIMLTAHQDVVPASSPERWIHPPYEAYFDGRHLWGRGASDCKNNLIGVLSTVEFLLEKNWAPKRTVILAFGFDEETGGVRGAAKISKHLQGVWGKDGIDFILDEGGMGLTTIDEYVYARPGVAEKGYMDALLTVDTPGGHSSRPPSPHSGIGIVAEIIVALEANPFTPLLTKENPFRRVLECQAKYTPKEVEPWLRHALEKGEHDIGRRLADARGGETRYSMQTSQAVDIIRGGDKVNALPVTVTATVNYRIAPHDSLDIIKTHIRLLAEPIVRKHNLELVDFDGSNTSAPDASRSSSGTLTLRSVDDLRPAPISPTNIADPVWALFSGTIRSVFETVASLKGKTVVPVGDIMLGNTDTIHYWDLTRNIYRFSPRREGTSFGVHTIDERVEMEAHLEGMRFYYEVILNFDEA